MKKFIVALFILVVIGGVVFYFGWVQFAIPAAHTGIMISKTGGISQEPIVPGEFRWSWEPLIPANCKIIAFSLRPVELSFSKSGALPSADLYPRFLEGSPDFSYRISASISLRARQADLPHIIEEYDVKSEDELNELLAEMAEKAFYGAAEKFVAQEMQRAAAALAQEEAVALSFPDTSIIASSFEEGIPKCFAVVSFSVTDAALPDFALYAEGAAIYAEYVERRREASVAAAVKVAEEEIASGEQMRLFAEWGSFLEKFPSLIDFLAVARDNASETLELLRDLKNSGSLEGASAAP